MLIRSYKEVEAAGRVVSISHGKSNAVRVLLKSENLGFSLSEARCGAGNRSYLWYKNHWEANYIRAGSGTLVDNTTEESWPLYPGALYCVGPNDKHSVVNTDDPLRIVSIFNPPIEGNESHDDDGAFPPTGDIPKEQPRLFVKYVDALRVEGKEKILADGTVRAVRMLTASDGLGFSVSDVSIDAGSESDLWYKHHWEANQILSGVLEVTDYEKNVVHSLEAGDVYVVGPKDRHHLRAVTNVHVLSIFNPPITGDEIHDKDGSYPPTGPIPIGPV